MELGQNNTDVAIPLLLSSKGYGILWNTASFTYVDNRFPLELNFESMAGDQVDYYVLYGPEMDRIIHEYRSMTGHAPLFPEWAYGLFQSKDRYASQAEILEIANQYRARHIPMDAIVQDWFWWKQGGEGDPEFNANYTDVPAELKTLHDEHVHAMISVWGMMDASAKNFKEIRSGASRFPERTSTTRPIRRRATSSGISLRASSLRRDGTPSGWTARSRRSTGRTWATPSCATSSCTSAAALEYTNIFPLEHTGGVQEHWKQANPEKRVFLLTRSAFLGQQRNGATVWSGDVYSTWWALRHQVTAGLNFALSGYPYWTTDIGGYHQPFNGAANEPAYQELYARWFEYGAFCPVFRTHGHRDHNELWTYDRVYPALLAVDRLRYRLLPYVYSLAWKVTSEDYTIQRPLVMDFREDRATWEIGDEFIFGPAILVSPVLREHATERAVYLPAGRDGTTSGRERGQRAGSRRSRRRPRADSAGRARRFHSAAGSGHRICRARPADPIELRIYPGADGDFNLYEDEGDSYRYEKGAHAIIPIHWDDATGR